MPRLVLPTFTSDPLGQEFADCDCAVVEVTAALMQLIRQRTTIARSAVRSDQHLNELTFSLGYEPEFFDRHLLSACSQADPQFQEQLDEIGCVLLPTGVALGEHTAQRTEYQEMLLRVERLPRSKFGFEIAWSGIPKHTELTITTGAVPFDQLKQFVRILHR